MFCFLFFLFLFAFDAFDPPLRQNTNVSCRFHDLQEVEGGAHAALAGLREAEEGPGERAGQAALLAAPGAALGEFAISHLPNQGSLVFTASSYFAKKNNTVTLYLALSQWCACVSEADAFSPRRTKGHGPPGLHQQRSAGVSRRQTGRIA